MKHRRAAPQGAPEQEPVTFIDVVSCFSEEEWKLLHNWQKELYRNVMKDIHQALLSLGPMIANSVFSLNPKGHEELCDMDFEDMKFNRDLKTFQGYSAGESNALSRKTRLAKQHLKNISDTNERGSCDRPSTAGPMMASSLLSRTPKGHEELCNLEVEDIKLNHDVNTYRGNSTGDSNTSFRKTRIASEHLKDSPVTNERGSHDMSSTDTAPTDSASLKEECDVETLDYSQPQGTKCPSGTTRPEVTRPAVSVSVVDDEESYAIETQDYGEEDVSSPVEPGDAMPYVPMGINEEGETYPIDIEDYGKSEGTSSYVGHEAAGAENKLPYKVSSEKINMFPASEKDPGSRSYVWPGSDWSEREMKSEKHESDFDDSTQSSLHHWTPKEMLSMGHSERDGGLFNVQIFAAQSDLENTGKPCTVAGSDGDLKQHIRIIEPHIRKNSVSRKPNYHCKVCGKGFRQKGSLICHERVHSGEKPYHCSVCDKRFTQKHRLVGHERTHSGERPFQCDICLKRFTWKDGLLKHYRTHTGERPYQCTKCMKCFSQKEGVIRHLKTHALHKQEFTPLNFPL